MQKPTVFVIMPFSDLYLKFFEYLQNELSQVMNIRNANTDNMINILSDILTGINESDYIIADITEPNANVYYELGIAHTLNRNVIMISQKISDLPFDINNYKVLEYSFHVFDAPNIIKKLLTIIIDKSDKIKFSNPVNDFIGKNTNKDIDKNNKENPTVNVVPISAEKGFMDYICELEEDTKNLTSSFEYITSKISDMSNGIEEKTFELGQIRATTKSNFLIKRKAEQASVDIKKFSKELKSFNLRYDLLWTKIYDNYIGLLDNKFVRKEKNKNSFEKALEVFIELQTSMSTVKSSFEDFKMNLIV